MNVRNLHSWDVTPAEAIANQKSLAGLVNIRPLNKHVKTVAGIDLSFDKHSNLLFAAVLVFRFPGMHHLETKTSVKKAIFPYVPGLLSYREIPPLIDCFKQIRNEPDVILCDGQGLAHPRRFGLACHLGILLNKASVGCAKSRLVGNGDEPGKKKGDFSPLFDKGEEIGRIVRTRDNVKPLYISSGHLVDLETSVWITLECCGRFRLPEPTRLAHHEVNRLRKQFS